MAVPALENGNESIIDRLKAEGQLTRNRGTNSLKVVISKLQDIFDLIAAQISLQEQQDTTERFQKDETESESDRFKGMKEFGGKVVEQTKKGVEAIGGFVSKILRALAGPALLALLAFLPEILNSKLFKEAIEFAQNTLVPLLISFKDNVLVPIANFFQNGFTKLFEDLNNPDMDFGDVVSENLPIIAASLAILFRNQILGLVTTAAPIIFKAVGALIAKGIAGAVAVVNPVGLAILAVTAIVGLMFAAFKFLDPEKQEAIKSAIKEKAMAAKDAVIGFFNSVVEGFKNFLLMLVPDIFGLKERAANILGVDMAAQAVAAQQRRVDYTENQLQYGNNPAVMTEERLEQERAKLRELEAQARNQNNVVISTNDSSQNQSVVNNNIQNGPIETQNTEFVNNAQD